jgi:hypothetical protein
VVVQHLPSICKTLSSISSKKGKERKGKEKGKKKRKKRNKQKERGRGNKGECWRG